MAEESVRLNGREHAMEQVQGALVGRRSGCSLGASCAVEGARRYVASPSWPSN